MYENEIMWTNTLFSVSTTISYIHFLYWLQLNPSIGPVVISASQVVTDVLTISSMYLILLCAFASGIIFIIGTEKITESIDFKPLNSSAPTPLQLYSESFWLTVESLFWSWLGPGESDLHITGNSSRAILVKVLVGIYQVIAVIVFLNLLIASMNSTVQKIQDKQAVYWKYARAEVWMRFFDKETALPPPWNLFYLIRVIPRLLKSLRARLCGRTTTKEKKISENYRTLIILLIRRIQLKPNQELHLYQ
ncbi:short transient receptor potential channel 5 [Eurytemora carolleeae]|uniref:short transient receptor potential channel 5 n=1 Tax=Eurytemora carolleeae TaxID=1294199 RepID=UPI000C78D1E7|nr:short transient receptor potential channel 5 [Eurytemora carolleeae]|eukprot:XP_023321005.1 short transient receptor potential channel 5-like [Eurytemora affinis]